MSAVERAVRRGGVRVAQMDRFPAGHLALVRVIERAIPGLFDAAAAAGLDAVFALQISHPRGRKPDTLTLTVRDGRLTVTRGAPAAPGATVTIGADDMVLLVTGGTGWPTLLAGGRLELSGRSLPGAPLPATVCAAGSAREAADTAPELVIAALRPVGRLARVGACVGALSLALAASAGGARPVVGPALGVGEMTAIFAQPSYAQGQTAQLRVVANADRLTVQPISALPAAANPLVSIFGDRPVGPARTIAWHPGAGIVGVHIGRWPSGVYFVRVRSSEGTAVAPVVLRPAELGIAHVAVVVPTFSWQAYNRRDGDTWYACTCVHTVDLTRPYLDSGVPYNFKYYDRDFLAWLARSHQQADVIADEDLNRFASGAQLRRMYRMIVFEGHGEYVTSHMFEITEQYRNLGGHLAFLSANQFFRDVAVTGRSMTLIGRFRDLGRPEAALIGAQYIDWNRNLYPDQQYVVRGAKQVPWLFAGTGLRNGSQIRRNFGVEIDGLAPSSPPHTVVVADIRDIFGGETAQMTYYTTRAGAEVFDAGTINFGGSALVADVSKMLSNLWARMAPR